MTKIDYRRITEWKTERVIFPKPLETLHTKEPFRSNSIIEYSNWFDIVESRREAVPNGSWVKIYRQIGSTWDTTEPT